MTTNEDLKVECLKLAACMGFTDANAMLRTAQAYYAWVNECSPSPQDLQFKAQIALKKAQETRAAGPDFTSKVWDYGYIYGTKGE